MDAAKPPWTSGSRILVPSSPPEALADQMTAPTQATASGATNGATPPRRRHLLRPQIQRQQYMNFLPILPSSSILPSLTFLLRADELRAPYKTWTAMEFLSYLHDELFSRWPISCWKKVGQTYSQGMVELLPSFGLLFAYSYVKFGWCVSISPGYKSFLKICLLTTM